MKNTNSIIIVTAIISIVFFALVFTAAAFIGRGINKNNTSTPVSAPVSASANTKTAVGADNGNAVKTRSTDKAYSARTGKVTLNNDLVWHDSDKAEKYDLVWRGDSNVQVKDLVWREGFRGTSGNNRGTVMV